MPKHKHDAHFLELARLGAKAQLNDLLHEVKMLIELFPDLRNSFDKDELPISFIVKRGAQNARRQKKRTMSVAAKKAISDAQKRRWARQKAAEKK